MGTLKRKQRKQSLSYLREITFYLQNTYIIYIMCYTSNHNTLDSILCPAYITTDDNTR